MKVSVGGWKYFVKDLLLTQKISCEIKGFKWESVMKGFVL